MDRERFLALLALAAVAGLIADEQQPRLAAPAPSLKRSRPDGKLIALAVAYGLFGFGYVIAATFISTLVRVSPDARVLEPVVWLAVGLAAVPSVPLWARWGRKIGNARAMAAACLVEAAGISLLVLSTSRAGVIVSAVLLGGTIMGITALGLLHARNLSRGDPRATLALLTAAFGLGQIVGPTLAGVLADAMETFAPAMLVSVAALLIGALFSLRAETRSWT